MDALGVRAAPVLREVVADPSRGREVIQAAAERPARLGDLAGIPPLIAGLRDPALQETWAIVEAIGHVEERAIEPLLAALADERDLEIRHRLLEALALLDGVRGTPTRLIVRPKRSLPR